MKKTNAARLLDQARVPYQLIPYAVDEDHLEATHVAAELGEDIATVYKTLVLRGQRHGLFVCVIAGDREVDLKQAAAAAGEKSVEMIHVRELLPLTGYIRGGCSPLGMKKQLPTFIDVPAAHLDTFYVSAGQRGLQLRLAPADLARLIDATFVPISK